MRRVIRTLIGILILVVGIFIFTYPDYREWKMNKEVQTIKEKVQISQQLDNIPENIDDEKELQSSASVTNQEAIGSSVESEMEEMYEWFGDYNTHLAMDSYRGYEEWDFTQSPIGSDAIGYIEIPEIFLSLPLYIGATETNMNNGAVVLSGTSMPIGGPSTNCVIAAHRGWRGRPYFRDVDSLKIGSKVIIHNLWEDLSYRVTGTSIIHETEDAILKIQQDKDLITLFSCYPYMSVGTDYRLVIFCERENIQEEVPTVETEISVQELIDVELEEKEISIEKTFTENLSFQEDQIHDILSIICLCAVALIIWYQLIRRKKN